MAKNYFKIFRVRKLADFETRPRPVERFVFFDDASVQAVQDAMTKAAHYRDELIGTMPVRICSDAPVIGVKCRLIGEFP